MADTDSRILEYLEEGLFLYGVGKVQESIARWKKVLELDPKNERAIDYIESAGGNVSAYRKGGAKPKTPPSTAPAPAARPMTPPPRPIPPPGPPPPVKLATPAPPPPTPPPAPKPSAWTPPPPPSAAGGWTPPPPPSADPFAAFGGGGPGATDRVDMNQVLNNAVAPQTAPIAPRPAPPPPPPPKARAPSETREDLLAKAAALYRAKYFEASLELLERIERDYPPSDETLRGYLIASKQAYLETLKATWSRLDLVPKPRMGPQQVMQLKLSNEAGFLLSRIDGMSTIDDILAMCGLDQFTALRALNTLLQQGAIEISR